MHLLGLVAIALSALGGVAFTLMLVKMFRSRPRCVEAPPIADGGSPPESPPDPMAGVTAPLKPTPVLAAGAAKALPTDDEDERLTCGVFF